MTFDPVAIGAFIAGIIALALAVKRDRRPVLMQPLDREAELTRRVAQLESTVATLQRLLYEKQTEIEALQTRIRDLERGVTPGNQNDKRRVLLVGVGDDVMLQEDLAQLRRVQAQTNIRISRLLPVSKASLERTIERHRAAGNPVKLLHLAVHSGPEGLQFSDGMASGLWLSQHLAGVEIAVLAGCEGDRVADLLGVVPAVVSMREEVDNRDASIFAGAFWLAVGMGMDANEAFERALQRAPATVGEFVELHL
jgi:hypothetical protein